MGQRTAAWLSAIILLLIGLAVAQGATDTAGFVDSIETELVTVSVEQQHAQVAPNSKSALAIHFDLKSEWHFYADRQTAPGGQNLKVRPSAPGQVSFSKPIYPASEPYFDKTLNVRLEVFSDSFTVFVPFRVGAVETGQTGGVEIPVELALAGAVCSPTECRPWEGSLKISVPVAGDAAMDQARFDLPAPTKDVAGTTSTNALTVYLALGLALLAGLLLNVMPCVWPVLPLIVMRVVEQAKRGRGRAVVMGLAFCLGIVLFFAALAGLNIGLRVFAHTVLQWGDQFRNPVFVGFMALLLVVMALFMFGVFTVTVPASVAGKAGQGKGYLGSVGMGFLAAILSTPCSFGILATVFAWAQTQPLYLGTLTIMLIGVGMAIPYAVLTSMPGLLDRLPRAGRWMELLKQAIGFVLLVIAVKLLGALPQDRRMDVLYFAVILSAGVWVWGGWVGYGTAALRKWLVRIVAVVLVAAAGWVFLGPPAPELIHWQPYDAAVVDNARAQGRAVLIKFTADWCLSCQVVDKTVYRRKDIAELIEQKGVLAVKADTTARDYPATIDLKEVYAEPGVPVTIFFGPGSDEPIKWRGFSFGDQLKSVLEKLPS